MESNDGVAALVALFGGGVVAQLAAGYWNSRKQLRAQQIDVDHATRSELRAAVTSATARADEATGRFATEHGKRMAAEAERDALKNEVGRLLGELEVMRVRLDQSDQQLRDYADQMRKEISKAASRAISEHEQRRTVIVEE